jgi:hypothetical protein
LRLLNFFFIQLFVQPEVNSHYIYQICLSFFKQKKKFFSYNKNLKNVNG